MSKLYSKEIHMNHLLLLLGLCAMGTGYLVNHEKRFLGIKPILLPFVLIGIMVPLEISGKSELPAASMVFLATTAVIVWLVRKGPM
jgi:hypothetical protein